MHAWVCVHACVRACVCVWHHLHVITTCRWLTVISKQQFPKGQSMKLDFFWRHDKFLIHWNAFLFRPIIIKKYIYYKRKMCLQWQEYQNETDYFTTQLLLAFKTSSNQIDECSFTCDFITLCPVMILKTHLCSTLHSCPISHTTRGLRQASAWISPQREQTEECRTTLSSFHTHAGA